MVGFAKTATIRARDPVSGPSYIQKRLDYLDYVAAAPWRAHQVPIANFKNPEHLKQLKDWMKSYRAHELFDERGKFRDDFAALAPTGHRRMGSNPHANGGELLVPLSRATRLRCWKEDQRT